jgi:hypothetical protein
MTFRFLCKCCNQVHEGVPTFGYDRPAIADWIPEDQRERRISLGSDDCVIDEERFLVRGCIEIPVHGEIEPFIWGAWVDLSKRDFEKWAESFDLESRTHVGPFAGYLGSCLPGYPDTFNHLVLVHLRDKGTRPLIEVQQSDHPLHREQCSGISTERLQEIYELVMHGTASDALYLPSEGS